VNYSQLLKPVPLLSTILISMISINSYAAVNKESVDGEAQRFQTNMTSGVTDVGANIFDLHMFALWVCVIIGVLTFGVMFYSLFRYRKTAGHKPATFHEHLGAEITWTIIPVFILAALAWPAITTLKEIYNTDDADIDILVTGYQWKWKYEYINDDGENISFFSVLKTPIEEIYNEEAKGEHYLLEVDEPVVIPVDTKVRFLITAYDVIHSWWVPALAVKKDGIPGFINETWAKSNKIGIYRGQCAELCGKDHGFMPIEVHVVSEDDYQAWKAEKEAASKEIKELMAQSFTMDEMMEKGKNVYEKNCAACHQKDGTGMGAAFPALKGSPVALGSTEKHISIVVNGVSGSAMAAYGAQLNDIDMAAVITYERNAWGNNVGDIVQPIDIFNFKKGQ
jgi:cytochrome c oxidase subunit II